MEQLMANPIHYGRAKAELSAAGDDFVVFLIGARINKLWKIHQWLPLVRAMPRMLRELEQHPELGLLGYQQWQGRTTIMVQYWRSMEHLHRYARSKDGNHLPAWRAFNQRARTDAVGLWHEAYVVSPAAIHTTYVNMPTFGLRRAAPQLPAASLLPAARAA
jgi:hypothetical protein